MSRLPINNFNRGGLEDDATNLNVLIVSLTLFATSILSLLLRLAFE